MSDITYKSPLYLQLREIIRNKIEDGEYPPGTAIPTEKELAETYGINRLSVRSAIETLANEGILKKIQGKGMFVMGEKVERELDTLGGFTQMFKNHHMKPNTRILSRGLRRAGTKFADIFKINSEDMIYYIKSLCSADRTPYSIDEIYIPQYILPKLEGIDLSVFTLDEIFAFYNIEIKMAYQTLDLTQLEQSDARLLEIKSNLAVMLFECVSNDMNDRVIEFSRTYSRADICSFISTFQM
ncbi:MAG: GntR family transcriptional regulator [Lachnospiraceae bacterium]|nr:GntR family transcriptional regulator [Lachnospiraceae bacterium]